MICIRTISPALARFAGSIVIFLLCTGNTTACIFTAPIRPEFCNYLVQFTPVDRSLWSRLFFWDSDRTTERSFALVIGISKYKHLGSLPPAAADVRHLRSFLIDNQHFDEVVVLENEDFTNKTLNYFLQDYFFGRVKEYPRSRFLFAFSGHGANTEGDPDGPSFILFNDAESFNDRVNAIDLGQLRVSLQQVSRRAFHTLVLINACYGGSFLDRSFGDVPKYIDKPGAMAITAGRSNELVMSLSSVGPGSVFYETLIQAVETGRADIFPSRPDGRQGNGIVTFEELVADLTASIAEEEKDAQEPLYGSIEPRARSGGGAFFFIAPSRDVLDGSDKGQEKSVKRAFGESTPTPEESKGGKNCFSFNGEQICE